MNAPLGAAPGYENPLPQQVRKRAGCNGPTWPGGTQDPRYRHRRERVLPSFVKIDIEVAEGLALAGVRRSVLKARPIFSLDLHTPAQDREVAAFFDHIGWDVFSLRRRQTGRVRLAPAWQENVGRVAGARWGWGNILAVHSGCSIIGGLIGAETGRSSLPRQTRLRFLTKERPSG